MQTSTAEPTGRDANAEPHANRAAHQLLSTAFTGKQQTPSTKNDDISRYVMMGGTAIVLTAAVIGTLRYRERIHACVSNAVPAICKGVADAKYALFDA